MPVPVTWEAYVDVPTGDEAALVALEELTAVSLPDDVREIILTRAGQVTDRESIIVGTNRTTPFSPVLYAGGKKDHPRFTYSIEFVLSNLVGWAEAGDASQLKLFPFATNTANGYFCLDYRSDPAAPQVVFVDLEYDFGEEGAIRPAAENLSDLLSKLQ